MYEKPFLLEATYKDGRVGYKTYIIYGYTLESVKTLILARDNEIDSVIQVGHMVNHPYLVLNNE